MAKKKKGKKKSPDTFNRKSLTNKIIGLYTNNPATTYNYKQIASKLLIKDSSTRRLITRVLGELASVGTLEEVSRGKFKFKSKIGYITGKVELTTRGAGYIISDEVEEDIFVTQSNLNHALNGDTVRVYLYARKNKKQPEGEVVEIINRAKQNIVGVIEISEHYAFLCANTKQMPYDLFIPMEKLKGAKNGDKVVARITDWPAKFKNPFGEIIEVLGAPGDNQVEMHAILAEFDLPHSFSDKVLNAAENIDDTITEEDIKSRRDFREITTFTIDPDDAKDFDDALSIRKVGEDKWEIGVHIADVTHYIKKDSLLDHEAYDRATSIYLVDRVVAMLPERLSNGICSLRPNEEKLCFSAVFEMDKDANVYHKWFGRTIIHSDRRFTYEEAQQVIETGEGDFVEEINTLNSLARKLRSGRFESGSISFDRHEVKFKLDEQGKPLSVFFREHKESNELIEEFMLLANKEVAKFIGKKQGEQNPRTFVYRIHDKPDPEKLSAFSQFISKFGYSINLKSNKDITKSINGLLESVQGKREQNLIETLAVRSMAKAAYSTHNIGHYGLAFDYYSHFTSPIRRFPDMMVHRLLAHYLDGGRSVKQKNYEEMCRHCSDMEKKSENAERASIKYKQVEFMQDKLGQVFEGVISGVAEWGFYVELKDNLCEGLVPIRELDDDFYVFDDKDYCIKGRRNRKKYQLGDPVNVIIAKTDLEKKQMDFILAD